MIFSAKKDNFRCHFFRAMIDLQRRNSDSSSENIPSEREVPPDVVSDESEDEQSSSDTSSNRSVSSVELSAASVQSPCSPLDIYAQGNSEIDVETGTGQDSVSRSSGVSNSDQSNYESDTSGNFGIEDFAKDWSLIQMGHHCSNQVADAFFKYAVLNCEKIKQLKDDNKGKIPDLSHLRRRLNLQFVPGVKMDFKFYDRNLPTEERATHPVEIFNVDSKPNRRYPMDKYDLIYQVSKVEVIICIREPYK